MKKFLTLILVAVFTALLFIPTGAVLADQAYHTERLPVNSVASEYPLRNGVVVNIHMNGPVIFGAEEWILNGAKPNTTYQLAREFQEPFLGIFPPETPLDSGFVLQTNSKGNGNSHVTILPAEVAPVIEYGQTTVHVRLVFIVGGSTNGNGVIVGGTKAYETDWIEDYLDQWK